MGALLISISGFAQHQTTDLIYSQLDTYLNQPHPENLQQLTRALKQAPDSIRAVQLAKVVAYCNIAYIQKEKNNLFQAIDFYEKAKHIFFSNALDRYDIIEYCLKPLGNLYLKTQALAEAENTIKQYILMAKQKGNISQQISGILNLSVLYYSESQFQKSVDLLKNALKEQPDETKLKVNLASSYFALGKIEKAELLLSSVLKLSPKSIQARRLLAEILIRKGKENQAVSLLKNILKSPTISRRKTAKLQLELANAYFSKLDLVNSHKALQQVYQTLIPFYNRQQKLPKEKQLYPETVLMDALDLQAALYQQQGESTQALKAYKLAAQINRYLFLQMYAQESRLLTQQNIDRRSERVLSILYHLYRQTTDEKWLEKALQIDSRTKGQVVLEAAALKHTLAANQGEKLQQLQALQRQSANLGQTIYEHTRTGYLNLDQMTELQQSYNQVLTRQRLIYNQLQSGILKGQADSPLNLHTLQEKADTLNVTLVSYFMGNSAIYQWVVGKGILQFNKLTSNKSSYTDFRELIRTYNQLFTKPGLINGDIPHFVKTSSALYEKLNLPKADKLLIIPDGILSFVPFSTLLTQPESGSNYEQMSFLVKESAVSYMLSLQEFAQPAPGFKTRQNLLGFFPVFKGTPQALNFSVAEAKSLKKHFPGHLLMNEKATKSAFLNQADQYSMLHISSHALGGTFHQQPVILFSDGTLGVQTLYGMHFSPQLVVLSACETGIGKYSKGEGALSLARGFRYAGAKNILFSLWEVNDKSTAEWMGYYYAALEKNWSRNFAVHQASLSYLHSDEIDNVRKSPYYWGAFSYYGTVDIPAEPASTITYLIAIGIIIVLLLFLLIKLKRPKQNSTE